MVEARVFAVLDCGLRKIWRRRSLRGKATDATVAAKKSVTTTFQKATSAAAAKTTKSHRRKTALW